MSQKCPCALLPHVASVNRVYVYAIFLTFITELENLYQCKDYHKCLSVVQSQTALNGQNQLVKPYHTTMIQQQWPA